jgi:magnesium transporter
MIRTIYYTNTGQHRTDIPVAEIPTLAKMDEGLIWVDLFDEPRASCEHILLDCFGFHPLAVEDAFEETQIPKVDDWETYLYIVLDGVEWAGEGDEPVHIPELDIFLGRHFVVTYHPAPVKALDRVWAAAQRDHRMLKNGADHLLYRLAHEQAMEAMSVIEQIDEMLDHLEDDILTGANPEVMEKLFLLKRTLLLLRRTVVPQREVFNKLARDPYAVVDEKDRIYFRDVFDHFIWLQGLIENLRDLVGGAMDMYLSVLNNRMNDSMRALTVITTLFLPLTFITGFFGMNFFEAVLPSGWWTGQLMLGLTLFGMLVIPVGMYVWMKRWALK